MTSNLQDPTSLIPGPQPFDGLDAECLLQALDAQGFHPDGRIMALNSYENRVYQVGLDDLGFVIAKFYRPGRWSDEAILEEHALLAALVEAEIPVAAMLPDRHGQTLFHQAGFRFALCPRLAGRPPELEDPDTLEALGRLIARVHLVLSTRVFKHRPSLNAETFGLEPLMKISVQRALRDDSRIERYLKIGEQALAGVRSLLEREDPLKTHPVHGDLYAGNILMGPEGPILLDLDDSRTAPPIQDLWMLAQGDPRERRLALDTLIEGYETFQTLPAGSLRMIEALRTLRLIHMTAWLIERQGDPAFPSAYPHFDSDSDWAMRVVDLEDQVERMAKVRDDGDCFPP